MSYRLQGFPVWVEARGTISHPVWELALFAPFLPGGSFPSFPTPISTIYSVLRGSVDFCRSVSIQLSPLQSLVWWTLDPQLHLFNSGSPQGSAWGLPLQHGLESLGNKLWGPRRILSFISHLLEITILHCLKSTVLKTIISYILFVFFSLFQSWR